MVRAITVWRHGRKELAAGSVKVRAFGVGVEAEYEREVPLLAEDSEERELSRAVDRLEQCSTPPTLRVYLSLLKSCQRCGSLRCVKRIQEYLAHHQVCNLCGILGENVVLALVKCGDVDSAIDVFCDLPDRTTFSWTAVIAGLVKEGRSNDALKMYSYMQEEGIEPDHYTFVSLLKACGNTSDLNEGFQIHDEVRRKGLTSDVYIGTTLISMYGKCGALLEAEKVWLELPSRNVVTWNSMLSAYIEQGQGAKALCLYRQIVEDRMPLDSQTLLICLQACSFLVDDEESKANSENRRISALDIGRSLHSTARRALMTDAHIGSALVSLYGKCDSIAEAENVYAGLAELNVVMWTSHISMYVELNQGGKALQLYREMQLQRISPNQQTLVSTLQACCVLAEDNMAAFKNLSMCLKIGHALHTDAQIIFGDLDAFVRTTLMSLYAKCGALTDAEGIFGSFKCHTIVQWNGMLSAYIAQHKGQKALKCYRQLHEEGMSPDHGTFVIALQACIILSEGTKTSNMFEEQQLRMVNEIGQALHADARKAGFAWDVVVGTSLVAMYAMCGRVIEAETVFSGLHLNVIAWNVMLAAYVDLGQGDKALHLFTILSSWFGSLSLVTLLCVTQACSDCGCLETCHQLHYVTVASGHNIQDFLANTLVHTYGNCASIEDAQAVFSALPKPLLEAWNASLAGISAQGNGKGSWLIFEELQLMSMEPNETTFTSILSACSHAGDLDEGFALLESMKGDFGLQAHTKQYVSMIDLLGRSGNLSQAESIASKIPAQHDLSMWLCLLRACIAQRNTMLGKFAFDRATSLQSMQAAPYVLMASVYASTEMSGLSKT